MLVIVVISIQGYSFLEMTYKRAERIANLPGAPAERLIQGVDSGYVGPQGAGVCEENDA